MRVMLIIATTALCLSASAQAKQAAGSIVADIELSEFTPALELAVDLDSGNYVITPPAQWPSAYPRSDKRSGTLTGPTLASVRAAFDRAFASGVVDQRCEAVNGAGYPVIVSNAGVAHMTLLRRGRRLMAASRYGCWTAAALALHQKLEQVFDRKTAS